MILGREDEGRVHGREESATFFVMEVGAGYGKRPCNHLFGMRETLV